MGDKIRKLKASNNQVKYLFDCPGCGFGHVFDEGWSFNGDFEKPTFSPSLLIDPANNPGLKRCHLFVRDGKILFLSDCQHDLAGQTVEMEDFQA